MTTNRQTFIFYGVATAFAITMMGTTMPTPIYPAFQTNIGLSQLAITVIYAIYAFGVMGALILLGSWSDQIGRRPLLIAGLCCSAGSGLIFLYGGSLAVLLAGRLLSGISAGIFTGTATVAVVELEPQGDREKATLVATAVNMGGLGLGPIFAGLIAYYLPYPMRMSFAIHMVLALCAIIVVIAAPETAQRPQKPKLSIRKPSLPAEVVGVFIPSAIAAFAAFAIMGMFAAISPAFLSHIMGFDNTILTGFIVFLLFVASIVGQVLQSRIRPSAQLPAGCISLMAGMILVIISFATALLSVMIIGGIIAGIGHGIAFRAGMTAITLASPKAQRAGVASSFFLVAYVAISLPVIGFGLLNKVTGLADAGMIFSALITLLALLSTVLIISHNRKSPIKNI